MRPRRPLVILAALIAALALSGCGAVAQMQQPCPSIDIYNPAWSPDGTKLSYIVSDNNGIDTVYVTELGGGTTALTDMPFEMAVLPAWSPDSSLMISAGSEGQESNYDFEVFTVDLDGNRKVFPDRVNGVPYFEWSPDGKHIAVKLLYIGNKILSDVLMLNTEGEIEWTLSELYSEYDSVWLGDWSPDSTQLAIGLTRGDQNYVAVIDAAGENLELLYGSSSIPDPIQWSPDGDWIALNVIDASKIANLIMVRPDGTDNITLAQDSSYSFAWNPDSLSLVYVTLQYEIANVTLDGVAQTILSTGMYYYSFGRFSPDASQLAYLEGGRLGAQDLFVMNIDGTDVHQITHNPGNSMCFHWPF